MRKKLGKFLGIFVLSAVFVLAGLNADIFALDDNDPAEKININVEKSWQDNDNEGNTRPDSITVDLKNGEDVVDTITISENNDGKWEGTFSNVPRFDDDGNEIDYTVYEHPVSGYTTSVEAGEITANYSYPTNISEEEIDTSTSSSDKVNVHGGTNWYIQPGLHSDKIKANYIVFNPNRTKIHSAYGTVTEYDASGNVVPADERVFIQRTSALDPSENGYQLFFEPKGDLPLNDVITTDHYFTMTFEGGATVLDDTGMGTARDVTIKVDNFSVYRSVANRDTHRAAYTSDNGSIYIGPAGNGSFGGQACDVTLMIDGVSGENILMSFVDIDVKTDAHEPDVSRRESVYLDEGFNDTIYTLPLVGNIEDETAVRATRFEETDGAMRAYSRPGSAEDISTFDSGFLSSATITSDGLKLKWTGTHASTSFFEQIRPFAIKRTVDEDTVQHTGGSISDQGTWELRDYGEAKVVSITPDNGYLVEYLKIDGRNIALDGFDENGYMEVESGYTNRNDSTYSPFVVNSGTETVKLYQRENGVIDIFLPPQYYTVEKTVPVHTNHWIDTGFKKIGHSKKYTITNELATIDIPVEKKWNDNNDVDNRPSSITVDLMTGDEVFQTITITPDDDGNWKGVFEDVPRFDDDGNPIQFTISEHPIEGYSTVIEMGELIIDDYEYPSNTSDVVINTDTTTTPKVNVHGSDSWYIQQGLRTDFIEGTQIVFNPDKMLFPYATLKEYDANGNLVPSNERVFFKMSANERNQGDSSQLGIDIGFKPKNATSYSTGDMITTDHYFTLTFPNGVTVLDGTVAGSPRDVTIKVDNISIYKTYNRTCHRLFRGELGNFSLGPGGGTGRAIGGQITDMTFYVDGVSEGDVLLTFVDLDSVANSGSITYPGNIYNESVHLIDGFSDTIYTLPLNTNTAAQTSLTYTNFIEEDGNMRAHSVRLIDSDTYRSGFVARAHMSEDGFKLRWTGSTCGSVFFSQIKPFKMKATVDENTSVHKGGSITQQGDWTYRDYGEAKVVTVTPNSGYHVRYLKIDGQEIPLDGFDENGYMEVTRGYTVEDPVLNPGIHNSGTEQVKLYQRENGVIDILLPAQYFVVGNTDPVRTDHWIDTSFEPNGAAGNYTLINTPTVQIEGTKTWVDGNKPHNNANDLVITLKQKLATQDDSEAVEYSYDKDTQLTWDGNHYVITGLPGFDEDGNEYEYIVAEIPPAGYEVTQDGNNFTNTIKQQRIVVQGMKVWLDGGKTHDNAEDVVITLMRAKWIPELDRYGTPEPMDTAPVWDGNIYTFDNLPKYDEAGYEYRYTVSESISEELSDSLPEDESYESVADDTGRNFINTLTGTTQFSGTKTWLDGGIEHNNAADITLVLYRESQNYTKRTYSATPTWNGNTYTYSNLPKYDSLGYPFTYSVRESAVMGSSPADSDYSVYYDGEQWSPEDGYSVTGTDITNVLRVDVPVEKEWKDDNNAIGMRPSSVKVQLLADGEPVDGKTLRLSKNDDPDKNWKDSFTDLPMYAFNDDFEASEIEYSVKETPIPVGYISSVTETDNGLKITNTLATCKLSGTKTLTGRAMNNGEFTFTIKPGSEETSDAVDLYEIILPDDVQSSASPDGVAAAFEFDNIIFLDVAEGFYKFKVCEVTPEDGFKDGVTYDTSVFTVTVSVEMTDAGLNVEIYDIEGGDSIAFENSYDATGDITPEGKKSLTGESKAEDEGQSDEGGQQETQPGDNASDETEQPTTDKQNVTESVEPSTEASKEASNEVSKGVLNEDEATEEGTTEKVDEEQPSEEPATEAEPTAAQAKAPILQPKAEASSVDMAMTEGQFEFEGRYANGDDQDTVIFSGKNEAAAAGELADIVFDKIEYTLSELNDLVESGAATKDEDGNYHISYVITETTPNDAYQYNPQVFTMEVVIKDNGDGTLDVTSDQSTNISFENRYVTDTAVVPLDGLKHFTTESGSRTMKEGDFSFTVTPEDGAPAPENTTAVNDAGGAIHFGNITFTKSDIGDQDQKTFEYTIKEEAGNVHGMTYDPEQKTVKITVYDDGEGHLTFTTEPEEAPLFEFNNSYEPEPVSGSVNEDIDVMKVLKNQKLKAGQFKFVIEAADEETQAAIDNGAVSMPEVVTVTNNANGNVSFGEITYNKSGTYNFKISEVIPDGAKNNKYKNITYDTTTYTVTAVVADDENGNLRIDSQSISGDANKAVFTNIAALPSDDSDGDNGNGNGNGSSTGDDTNLLIYILTMITSLLLMLVLFLDIRRRRA